MKTKIFMTTIVFLLMTLVITTSCNKNKSNQKDKVVISATINQKERIDNDQISKIVNYGLARALMYRDCFLSLSKVKNVNGTYTFEVLQLKDSMEEFDNIVFLKCKEIAGLNFMIRTKGEVYYYAGCVSDDDVKIDTTNLLPVTKYDSITIRLSNLAADKMKTYINASDYTKTINNIKQQINIIFEESDLRKNQNFYIGPFSNFDLGIRMYWVEKKCFIDLSRAVFDMELKNIAAPQLIIRDSGNKDQVDTIVKNGELITVVKSK